MFPKGRLLLILLNDEENAAWESGTQNRGPVPAPYEREYDCVHFLQTGRKYTRLLKMVMSECVFISFFSF